MRYYRSVHKPDFARRTSYRYYLFIDVIVSECLMANVAPRLYDIDFRQYISAFAPAARPICSTNLRRRRCSRTASTNRSTWRLTDLAAGGGNDADDGTTSRRHRFVNGSRRASVTPVRGHQRSTASLAVHSTHHSTPTLLTSTWTDVDRM